MTILFSEFLPTETVVFLFFHMLELKTCYWSHVLHDPDRKDFYYEIRNRRLAECRQEYFI